MTDGHDQFAGLHFAPAPDLHGPVPGPRSVALLDEQAALESRARSYPRAVPIALEEGRGATLRDVDGNTFLDFFGGAGALNLGHGHPVVAAAATAQQRRLVHALDFPTVSKNALMRSLKDRLPGALRRTARFHFGGPTGSDAVEAALKLTRTHTGRSPVIAFHGSYHGMTSGALSVSSDTSYRRTDAASVQFVPYPYCYRCPLGLRPDSCGLACAKLVETVIADPHSGTGPPAAVIVEPIQGEGGTVVPPPGYLAELRRMTAAHDVPLICDEIQTGFGRTGSMFGADHDGIVPDVMTLSKAIGGIGYPLSCIAYDEALDTWEPGAHIGTFRGHQVAMAAGVAALEVMDETDLPGHAGRLGELALATLRDACATLESVGDVRGRGLILGVELVRDRETREPWPELTAEVRRACLQRGLIVEVGGHFGNVVRFLPPLVITRELLLRGLEIFTEAVRERERVPTVARVAA
ncbi:MAG TPA: aminotransferase class III-fold pyridoxal phosphate-dependent enzyme [Baekduia sp.]|uniref:aspartate aminotransferase family protein n=1 Tax=Baekduia sp. TaxID=2600305 RepID=UPI002B8989B0|nr:aminotransferase class III-fold pyridoxal phosphate-dependent enzyme [Baekduia sp.]HMJ32528.1 aminotransferase class III-fold pyridoxal phosphate-dependent enzyme [Baekduia sp.]